MIVLCTDFGLHGPYTGQVRTRLLQDAPGVPVVNLFADLPAFNARAAAYLLAAYCEEFPEDTVFLCVVDPGVGSARRPLIVKTDHHWFVGPDNGLLEIAARRARRVQRWEITYAPAHMSASFHGRDLFAPVAAQLATKKPAPGCPLTDADTRWDAWPDDLFEIVYIDRYGNAMAGVRGSEINTRTRLVIKGRKLAYARTFSEAPSGQPFWYENANGVVEIALREASAAHEMGLRIGDPLKLAPDN